MDLVGFISADFVIVQEGIWPQGNYHLFGVLLEYLVHQGILVALKS
jgi:hypothetical protein